MLELIQNCVAPQTILPIFDYSGFLLMSCNKSDRGDLQVMGNNILRTCYNVKLVDCMSLVDMHRMASLVSLDYSIVRIGVCL